MFNSFMTNFFSVDRKKLLKASEIIDRNFTWELQKRETEIEKLDSMILQVQKSLHLIRYAVVSNLYSGPNIVGQVLLSILGDLKPDEVVGSVTNAIYKPKWSDS